VIDSPSSSPRPRRTILLKASPFQIGWAPATRRGFPRKNLTVPAVWWALFVWDEPVAAVDLFRQARGPGFVPVGQRKFAR
jgi:hypothetical protein